MNAIRANDGGSSMRNVRTNVALPDRGALYPTGIVPVTVPAQPFEPTQSTRPLPESVTVSGLPAAPVVTFAVTRNPGVFGRQSTRAGWPACVGVTVTSTMFSLTRIGETSRFPFGTR